MYHTYCVWLIGFFVVASAAAQTPQAYYAAGSAKLASGDLIGASQLFEAAVRGDPTSSEYRAKYDGVQQAIGLSQLLDSERDDARWLSAARRLKSFYDTHRLAGPLLVLTRRMHNRLHNEYTTELLAQALIANGQPQEAIVLLRDFAANQPAAIGSRLLLVICSAQTGRQQEAEQLLRQCVVPLDANPAILYSLSRALALLGHNDEALERLNNSISGASPELSTALIRHAKASPDFGKLRTTEAFEKALVPQSRQRVKPTTHQAPLDVWINDFNAALREQVATQAPMLLLLTSTNNCVPCAKLRETLLDSDVTKVIYEKYVLCRLDANEPCNVAQLTRLMRQLEFQGYPSLAVLDVKSTAAAPAALKKRSGYMTPAQFLTWLK